MQKTILSILVIGALSSSCSRQVHDPYEVLDQSYIHRYGVEVPQSDWTARGETGQVVTTLKSGVIVTKTYTNGVLEGDTIYSFPHSKLTERVETYAQGQLIKEMAYFRNGTPSEQIVYNEPHLKQIYGWYDNGSARYTESYQHDFLVKGDYYGFNHQLDSRVEGSQGTRTKRDPFGNLEGVDIVEHGMIIASKTFYANGAVKQLIPYTNGVIEGQVKTYHPGGEPSTIETWVRGEQTGLTSVYENGELVAEIPYRRGVKEGIEKRYRDGAEIVEEISWAYDMKHGPTMTYIVGSPKSDFFFQGKPVSRSTFEKMTNGMTTSIDR